MMGSPTCTRLICHATSELRKCFVETAAYNSIPNAPIAYRNKWCILHMCQWLDCDNVTLKAYRRMKSINKELYCGT